MKFKLDRIKENFKKHLNLADNDRVIFSGAFGTGKTYFLNDFFANNSDFEAIHLYPVNYSIASNEDIFELIKYDILFGLLEKDLDFGKVDISKGAFLPFFLKNHSLEILPIILGFIPKIGGSLVNIAKNLVELESKFSSELKKANLSEKDEIITYLREITSKKGNPYEEDFYTQLICKLVDQLKESKEKKKAVLIIDDLDRIDPEHIFRIFNVLAAHVDLIKNSSQNKFNFDKIILVCDIQNIKKIFANRYGMDVDFSGYVDKFYSRSIYQYNLSFEIEERFRDILERTPDLNTNSNFSLNTIFILLAFLQYNLLPIRVLLRNLDSEIKNPQIKVSTDIEFGKEISNSEIEFISTVNYLNGFFQSYEILINNCKQLIGKEIKNPLKIPKQLLITEIVKAISFRQYYKNTIKIKDESEVLSVGSPKYTFTYIIKRSWSSNNVSKNKYEFILKEIKGNSGSKIKPEEIEYFDLLTWVLEESKFAKLIKG